MKACGKGRKIMKVSKRKLDIGKEKDIENAIAENETMRAFIDYNVAMGNIEDPTEGDEEGGGEDE